MLNGKPQELSSGERKKESEYGSLTENVKSSLKFMRKTFNKNDIIQTLGYQANENSLDGCLRRLVKQGWIEVVRAGKGRRPTQYRTKKEIELTFESNG